MVNYKELLNDIITTMMGDDYLLKGDNKMKKRYDKLNENPEKALQFVLAATINVYYYYSELAKRAGESISCISNIIDSKFDSSNLTYVNKYLVLLERTREKSILHDFNNGIDTEKEIKDKIDELCGAFNIVPLDLEMDSQNDARPCFTNIIIGTIAKYNDEYAYDKDKVSIPYVIEILHRANDEYVYDLEKNSSINNTPQSNDRDTDKTLKQLAVQIKDAFGKALKNRDNELNKFIYSIAECLGYPADTFDDLKELENNKSEEDEYTISDAFKISIHYACKTYVEFFAPPKKKEPKEDAVYIEVVSPKVVPASGNKDEKQILHDIEVIARTCYKSEDKMTEDSAEKMVRNLIKSEHMAMLEHESISIVFTCDRGISHEIVRHRMASYAQESTRYCNYSKGKFGHKIKVINPMCGFDNLSMDAYKVWSDACNNAAEKYFKLIEMGAAPQLARDVLPTSTATTIVVTMNIREWRHFFKLRSLGTTGAPHPQMKYLADKALEYMAVNYPVLFGDLYQ